MRGGPGKSIQAPSSGNSPKSTSSPASSAVTTAKVSRPDISSSTRRKTPPGSALIVLLDGLPRALQVGVAPENARLAVLVHLRRDEDHIPGRVHRGPDQRVVLADARPVGTGRLGELHVVADRLDPDLGEPVDQLPVPRARQRPALLEVSEGDVVDLDHRDVERRRLGTANGEPGIDGV